MKQAVEIFQYNNLPIDYLNLGGGFGIEYDNNKNQLDINKLSNLINDTYPNPSFKISAMRIFIFEFGISTAPRLTIKPFRRRVKKSAIGSVIITKINS